MFQSVCMAANPLYFQVEVTIIFAPVESTMSFKFSTAMGSKNGPNSSFQGWPIPTISSLCRWVQTTPSKSKKTNLFTLYCCV